MNFPAPRGGVFAASLNSALRLLSCDAAASGEEFNLVERLKKALIEN
jgi:hypothetical protein